MYSCLTLVTATAVWLLPVGKVISALERFRTRNPAPPPSHLTDDGGRQVPWRPPTRSGRYQTEAEYKEMGEFATKNALRQLFTSQVASGCWRGKSVRGV